ncbi:thermonuclease family protein [Flavobacterium rhizosphaerae]|uniref:Thermonuclease family protein n=1 Tax=Flavobacterium rhizosphaerae TaxID=3163298 RepID=A0ABW8YX98_9FLAO
MAKRRTSKPKYSIATLLVMLILAVLYNYNQKTQPDSPRKGNDTKEVRALKTFTGKVTAVKDGDTFEVLYDGQPERVRLAEIDCPEKKQAYGMKAKQYASDLCFGKIVTVESGGKRDRYGRVVGTVITQEGINVNEEMIKAGYAWHYKDYSNNAQLGVYEEQARQQHLGLWAAKRPQAPWEYRRDIRRRK